MALTPPCQRPAHRLCNRNGINRTLPATLSSALRKFREPCRRIQPLVSATQTTNTVSTSQLDGQPQQQGQPQPQQPASAGAPPSSASSSATQTDGSSISSTGFVLRPVHIALFTLIFVGGAVFAAVTLQFTADMEFSTAVTTVLRRVAKSVAFRQLVVIAVAILLVRFGLNSVLKALAAFSSSPVQWDKTKTYYILREVYQPLELLLMVAALCTIADTFVPSLISVPKSTVSHVVKSILSTSFIIGFSSVVFNLKSRFCKENAWQAEMKGDITAQRRWEAYDKLGTFVIYVMSFVLGIQAIGLEVTSVLAIGGIGGLAIGLAGREICENLLNGFLIMSTSPFEVGDEVHFFHSNKNVEGIVMDIGWYRTQIRSFEREVFVIPNAVFSKNIVLNISRKNREWRFFEQLAIRVQDVQKANNIVNDIRRIVRNDTRIINKLHRRIFLDKITHEDCKIYLSFYLEAANRDAFMAIKQDLLLSFVDCVERNEAKLATPRTVVDMDPEMSRAINAFNPMLAGLAAAGMAQAQQTVNHARLLAESRTTITAEAVPVSGNSNSSTSTSKSTSSNSSSSSSSGGGSSGGGSSGGSGNSSNGAKAQEGPAAATATSSGSSGGSASNTAVAIPVSSVPLPLSSNNVVGASGVSSKVQGSSSSSPSSSASKGGQDVPSGSVGSNGGAGSSALNGAAAGPADGKAANGPMGFMTGVLRRVATAVFSDG
eukprot:CAMPEP_0202913296 /NCGR_PEP_ID=MMETSP1392-20130828/60112_1 /ASSEMBLY_ACC=CAM_ASM_000868 /TAXON_ID=225041 /ORGANISM="Chlamydomonas chlamydogama, Strain SAG 11-48b" /LENGTH=714 /DNA_ID=CAMNT_0049604509 /DNA_START=272 /DNA_END=2416 /DNA_ORIENTATION=-